MIRPGNIISAVIRMILCLAILMTPSWLYARTNQIDGEGTDPEPWLGPGDPEGGDRYLGDDIYFTLLGAMEDGASTPDVPDERIMPPLIRLIPIHDGYLLIIGSGKALQAYPILLSR